MLTFFHTKESLQSVYRVCNNNNIQIERLKKELPLDPWTKKGGILKNIYV